MKFLMIIYTDDTLMERLPEGQFDAMMRGSIEHTDELREEGHPVRDMDLVRQRVGAVRSAGA